MDYCNMGVTILAPISSNKTILSRIENALEENDELLKITNSNTELAKEINNTVINNSYNECIVLVNTSKNLPKSFLDDIKREYDPTRINIAKNMAYIAFSKVYFRKIPEGKTNIPHLFKQIRDAIKLEQKRIEKENIKEEDRLRDKIKPPRNPDGQRKRPEYRIIGKPKILFISDVKGWAWWNKAKHLEKYLSDEFEIDIIYLLGKGRSTINPNRYDLYVTFGYSYVNHLNQVPFYKRITGITAHRPTRILMPEMKKVFATHANSVMLYKELEKMHDNTFYVPNGVDEMFFNIKKEIPYKRDNLVVGHVGKMCPAKHQKDIIEPAVKAAGVEYKPIYNNYINALSRSKIANYYQDVDVMVFCSSEDGTPNGMLEAAACGRPTIINHIGNAPEFIDNGKNGVIVPKNSRNITKELKKLKNNRDQVIEMGKEARKTVEEGWTWEIQSENYRQMFWSCLGGKEDE